MEKPVKEYVVVEFTLTEEVATIHKSWIEISDEKMTCYWPERDQLKLAAKHTEPDKAVWSKWDIRILSSSDELKTARGMERNAQFTSDLNSEREQNSEKKQRKRKPPRKFLENSSEMSSSESDLPTPNKKPTPKKKLTQKKLTDKPVKQATIASRKVLFPPHTPTHEIAYQSEQFNQSSCSISKECPQSQPTSDSREAQSSTHSPKQINLSLENNELLHSLKSKVEFIERTVHKLRYDIKEVMELQQVLLKTQNQKSSVIDTLSPEYLEFEKRFPLQNPDQIMELENSLHNEELNRLLADLIKQIGGVSVEDSVKRVCVRLFTNEAASHFSWEGRKGKLSLNNLKLIKTIASVMSNGPHKNNFTLQVFEFRLREWFRQAKTRIRGKKPALNPTEF